MVIKKIVITSDGKEFHIDNTKFEFDVELNEETIEKCLALINSTDSPSNYQICLLANNTILRVKPK